MNDAADLDDDYSDTKSVDSCEDYIHFESIRNPSTQLEESISFSWPGIYYDQMSSSSSTEITSGESSGDDAAAAADDDVNRRKLHKIILSTLLQEDDIAPLFDGAQWAGTRLWRAAIRSIQYLAGHLPDTHVHPSIRLPKLTSMTNDISCDIDASNIKHGAISVLELGCGLGVPGMIFHLLGCNVVLTDQENILSQLRKNVNRNFPYSSSSRSSLSEEEQTTCFDNEQTTTTTTATTTTIQALPLSWSRKGVHSLLKQVGRSDIGFDIVLNCDCVFEPLYGKSWHLLNETIDELLLVNPNCIVISSMERRNADGIDDFLEEMRSMANVGTVTKVWSEEGKTRIEIYQTRGKE